MRRSRRSSGEWRSYGHDASNSRSRGASPPADAGSAGVAIAGDTIYAASGSWVIAYR